MFAGAGQLQVIQAFTANAAVEPLDVGVLPRTS